MSASPMIVEVKTSKLPVPVLDLVSVLNSEDENYQSQRDVYSLFDAAEILCPGRQHEMSVQEIVDRVAKKKLSPVQHPCFQLYDLGDMLSAVSQGELFDYGRETLQRFEETVLRPMNICTFAIERSKTKDRAIFESLTQYGNDHSKLHDVNSTRISCDTTDDCIVVVKEIEKYFVRPESELVELQDELSTTLPKGQFRVIRAYLRLRGVLWEVLVAPFRMWEAKQRATPVLQAIRFVHERALLCSVRGQIDFLQEMLSEPGVSEIFNGTKVTDKNGLSCLHHAAARGDLEMCRTLIQYKADVWHTDKSGSPPLLNALQFGWTETAMYLANCMSESPVDQVKEEALFSCVPYKKDLSGAKFSSLLGDAFSKRVSDRYRALLAEKKFADFYHLWHQSRICMADEGPLVGQHVKSAKYKVAGWVLQTLDANTVVDLRDMELVPHMIEEIALNLDSPVRAKKVDFMGNLEMGKTQVGAKAIARFLSYCEDGEVSLRAVGLCSESMGALSSELEHLLAVAGHRLRVRKLNLSANYEIGRFPDGIQGLRKLINLLSPYVQELNVSECGVVRRDALLLQKLWGDRSAKLLLQ